MQDQWMREGKGFLLVYSITSSTTFDEVIMLRDKILRTKDDDSGENVPIVLAGNKCDLTDSRQVSTQQGQELAKEWGCTFYETSAKNKINNVDVFYAVVRLIREMEEKKKNQNNNKPKKKGICSIL